MSDWRDDDSEEPKRKSAAGKPAKALKKRKQSASGVEADWREPADASQPSSNPRGIDGRRWRETDDIFDEHVQAGSLSRWLKIGSLSAVAVILIAVFIAIILPNPPLIVRVLSSGKSLSPELGALPFSTDRDKWLRTNGNNNVAFEIKDEPGYDRSLASLFEEDWLANLGDEKKSRRFVTQGPGKKFVPFYISCFVTIRNEHMFLYSQDKNPFGKSETGLPLSGLLTKLASAVAEDAKAWIILDVQLPPMISNVCDLAPKWETAAQNALKEITEESRNRVIVTLPCSNYQQNALSPEHASSFFGYSLRELLTDYRGKGLFEFNLTFGKFLQKLNARVTNEVVNKRYALQQPVTLPQAAVDQVGGMKLVRIIGGSQTSDPSYDKAQLEERLKEVRRLYDELIKHRDAYRSDPIGYAIAEQELQRLEQAAIVQSESSDEIDKRVENALLAIREPRDISFGVSVIEDASRLEYFGGEDFKEVDQEVDNYLALLRDGPTESAANETAEAAEKKPVPGQRLEGMRRVLYEWRVWVKIAKKPTNEIPLDRFTRENLLRSIADVDTANGTWMEINFLRILARDIDWDQDNVEVRLVADAIRLFDQVQRLGTTPEPEIAWFLRSQLAPAEKHFLQGIDWLLVGNWINARKAFDQAESQLNELEPTAIELLASLNATQKALHLLPHLLKWHLSEYVFASEVQAIEGELKELAGVANLASQFYDGLSKLAANSNADLLTEPGKLLQKKWRSIEEYFFEKVKENKGAASVNAETFRHDMLALSIPLLSVEQRADIHKRILSFLDPQAKQIANTTEPLEDTLPKCRNAADAAPSFEKELEFDQEMWSSILSRDMRFDFSTFEESYLASKDPEPERDPANVVELRGKLLKHEFPLRIMAFVIGSGPSIREQLSKIDPGDARLTQWPLAAAWQRWNLASVYQRLWQIERLGEQAWGDQAYTKDTLTTDFYFARLAQKYLAIAIPPDLKLEFGTWLENEGRKFLEQRANSLRQLNATIADPEPIENNPLVRAELEFGGGKTEWQAVANFFLEVLPKRTPGTPWELGPSQAELWTSEAIYNASLWEDQSTQPNGKLAIRGNYLFTQPVTWSPPSEVKLVYELKLSRPVAKEATIIVLPPSVPPRINVWMLIDCSASMDTKMVWLDENGQSKSRPSFEAVKNNANRILDKFREMHDLKEADVRFGLIAFGLTKEPTSQLDQFEKSLELSNLKAITPNIFATSINSLEDNWPSDLYSCLEKLCADEDDPIWPAQWARRNTPLYNAIDYACKTIPSDGEQAFLYVLGDGVNNNEESHSASVGDIKELLRKSNKLRLSFFLFDNYEAYKNNLIKPKDMSQGKWDKEISKQTEMQARGLNELEETKRTLGPKKFDYRESTDVDVLLSASLESVPRLTLDIRNTTKPSFTLREGTQLGEPVEIGPEYLPSDFEVKVGGELYESRHAEFRLQGGENLTLAAEDLRDVQIPPDSSSGRQTTPVGGKLDGNAILNTRFSAQKLTLDLQFWNGRPNGEVTRRPEFILAEATDPDDANSSSFLVADYLYAGFKFPEAQSIPIPWKAEQWLSLRIWAADNRPDAVQEIPLDTNTKEGENNLGEAIVLYERKAERIAVTVRYKNPGLPQRNQRVVVLCPWFQEVDRQYFSDLHEKHIFVLPAALQNKKVPLWITTVQSLQESARKPAPDCKEFFFPRFRSVGN